MNHTFFIMKILELILVTALLRLLSALLRYAEITWGTPQAVTDESDVSTNGFVDLSFRNRPFKNSLGMEQLHCKTPPIIRKKMQMSFIAYNLIRALVQEAAARHSHDVIRISFEETIRTHSETLESFALSPTISPRLLKESWMKCSELSQMSQFH